MLEHERAAARRRLRDIAGRLRDQAKQLVAESDRACDTLRAELAALEAEMRRLREPQYAAGTAAVAGHAERYGQELSERVTGLREALASETERLAMRRRQLDSAARGAAGLQRLVDRSEGRAKRDQTRAEQRSTDERNNWSSGRGD